MNTEKLQAQSVYLHTSHTKGEGGTLVFFPIFHPLFSACRQTKASKEQSLEVCLGIPRGQGGHQLETHLSVAWWALIRALQPHRRVSVSFASRLWARGISRSYGG